MVVSSHHDHLFRRVFSERANAESLLRSILPPALVAAIDWTTLRHIDGSFVDDELRVGHTDLLFSVEANGVTLLIHVLLEHKSTQELFTALQTLGYVLRIWNDWRRKNPSAKRLPPILPIVVHHGDGPWRMPTSLRDLIDPGQGPLGATILALQPDFRFVLDDLAALTEADLRYRSMTAAAHLTALLLQFVRSRPADEALAAIERWRELIATLAEDPTGHATLFPLWSWVLRATTVPAERLREVVARISPRAESTVMNAAEKLEIQGQTKLLLRLLARRFGEIPPAFVERVRSASLRDLEHWADRVLDAPTLEAVLRDD